LTDINTVLEEFESTRVLLIGDTILDIYTYGSAMGLSAETPTIVARKKEMKHSLGGAALVCRNLLELGATVDFITLMGADDEAAYVRGFSAPKLNLLAVEDAARPTTVKHRFWVDGYKLFQLDQRDDKPVSETIADRVLALVDEALTQIDVVVISDYRHGLLPDSLVTPLLRKLHSAGKPVYVDSQVSQNASNHRVYRGNCIISLNVKEARCIDPGFEPADDPAAFAILNRELDSNRLIVKLGADGASFQHGNRVERSPANKVNVIDTTGAGDSFLAAFCLAGLDDPLLSLRLANAWAGLAIQIHGTEPPRKSDLLAAAGSLSEVVSYS
jgi:rfaE bifunctional protein kinase chain/domain